MLYVRMLFSMFVSLYTSRVLLNTLGVTDFGIKSAVGGLVATFAVISGSLNASSQRFLTFELGKKKGKVSDIFSASLLVHIILGLLVLIFAETLGLYFLNTYMDIDSSRLVAANWVYQFSCFTFIISLVFVPYHGALIAYERMGFFAFIGIFDVVLKLVLVLLLPFFKVDKLIVYSFLLFLVSISVQLLYIFYCYYKIKDIRLKFVFDLKLMKKIASFAGWNFIGASSHILMTQGLSILLNLFHGVIANAAYAISRQVQNAVTQFISNFMTALNPQITKSYASGDERNTNNLIFFGVRFSYYLILLISLPIILKTNYILTVWLTKFPENTVIFVRLVLIYSILQTFSNPLITLMLATGNIKKYQIIVGGIQSLNFPFSFIVLKLGFPMYSPLIISIILSLVCFGFRLYLLKGLTNLPVIEYINKVLLNIIYVTISSLLVPLILIQYLQNGLVQFIIIGCTCVICTIFSVYFLGLSSRERKNIYKIIKNRVFLSKDYYENN